MKNSFVKIFALALLVTASGAHAKATHYAELTVGPGNVGDFGAGWGTGIYNNATFKLSEKLRLVPEFAHSISLQDNAGTLSHGLARLSLVDDGFAAVGTGKFRMTYRWVAPTTTSMQASQTKGVFDVRPQLSWKFGENLNLMVRNNFRFNAVKTSYNPSDRTTGNSLFTTSLEAYVGYGLPGDIGISLFVANSNTLKGAPATAAGSTSWSNSLYYELEAGYMGAALWDTTASLVFSNNTAYGNGADISLASDSSGLVLKLTRSFK